MKLLIATDFPPDAAGGGPAVVRQMLRGFSGEIHWWSCRSAGSSVPALDFKVLSFDSFPPGKLTPSRKWTHLKAWLMEYVWAPLAAQSLRKTIKSVQPDCIWVIPHCWSIFPLHTVLVLKRLETSVHLTIQDYPDILGLEGKCGKERVAQMAKLQEELYILADSRDATSLPMLDDLVCRLNIKGAQMLHQGLEAEDFDFLEKSQKSNEKLEMIRIAYAGTILVEEEFEIFAKMLSELRDRGLPLRLEFWGAHSYASCSWYCQDWMGEHGNLPEKQLLAELRTCDWGFIPMSLENEEPRYNRFSFPTKFITYLAAGLPIISMGHAETSVMKMSAAYDVGCRISDPLFPISDLGEILQDIKAKEKYRYEILRCAREQFDAEKMRKKLWDCFRKNED
ncbi:MAG: hypothetical protein SH807_06300 [Blastochloris sp.]|nr:hypothetical protein [Blastochloris sp.]